LEHYSKNKNARLIAYYLPQYHPITENDIHWGKGFTEWTNVTKAKALFKGHYQPFLPTELGYYDLRVPEVRKAQADLAREYGIEGFCYWHYWFAGKRLLETPFNEVIKSGEPNFPFCLCWANHSWSAVWRGDSKKIIVEQTYPGVEDYTKHFYELLPAFRDPRYIKVHGRLMFSIFSPRHIPNCIQFTKIWRALAVKEGLEGFYFIGMGVEEKDLKNMDLDGCSPHTPHSLMHHLPLTLKDKITYRLLKKNYVDARAHLLKTARIYSYADFVEVVNRQEYSEHEYPAALSNWDHSPRSGRKGFVLHGSSPELYGRMLSNCVQKIIQRPFEERIVFLKAWNEWAEGNYLEPDSKFGRGYLEAIKKAVEES
jgi:lipopolysaccharide biosynthesis protein